MAQVRRVAMLSLHTSPLEQPGSGDAGGLNVYVRSLGLQLARTGIEVDIFTRAPDPDHAGTEQLADGLLVRYLSTGDRMRWPKEELPAHLASSSELVLLLGRYLGRGHYDIVHSHYWLSGMAGLWAATGLAIPLVHAMHTMARVKNRYRGPDEAPEPALRIDGEQRIVERADGLIANTGTEAAELVDLYGASRDRIDVIAPGVDLEIFQPGSRAQAKAELGIDPESFHILFAGRIQRLKGPHVLVEAMARLCSSRPDIPLQVSILGAASGSALYDLAPLIRIYGLERIVSMHPPVSPEVLARWYRSADLVAMPSSSESFGLVALEAQACGIPVLATRVGGLAEAVKDGETGVLVHGHGPGDWAAAVESLFDAPQGREQMGRAAVGHARTFGWDRTAQLTADSYGRAVSRRRSL